MLKRQNFVHMVKAFPHPFNITFKTEHKRHLSSTFFSRCALIHVAAKGLYVRLYVPAP